LAELACYFSSTFIPKDAQNAVSNKGVGVKLAIAAMQWGLSCDDEVLNSTLESVSFIRSREVNVSSWVHIVLYSINQLILGTFNIQ
jgi:hypothetical protein